ncbi:MAG: glucans biosynthesis glucosyltransferase MdoH [Pseudomonadota bacterium]
MTVSTRTDAALAPTVRTAREHPSLTPAELQSKNALASRRAFMLAVNAATVAVLGIGVWQVFAPGGMTASDWVILAAFLIGMPWVSMGVWNALVGLYLLHGRRDGLALAAPHLAAGENGGTIQSRVALIMTVRNEAPERSFARLVAMRTDLDASGQGHLFEIHILSDTSEPAIAAAEEHLFATWRNRLGGQRAHYRRRARNTGYKAGNVREFVTHAGRDYPLFLPLDSDSLMDAATILKMVRIMEAYPRLGILQSLVVGAPATSAFARIFQFGMRHGMRSFTMGAAWWQGDCGPFWGHNALIRTAAFRRHCRLPVLDGAPPLGGHILSHDQIEAATMRRAGFEVRVIPVESGSYEDNPPTLQDFTKRDLRWCQGNMQYFSLLGLKGLRPASRFQVFAAIMMYFGAPAWMVMTLAAASKMLTGDTGINWALGTAMFFAMIAVSLVPKILGMLDIALTRGGVARYGGSVRFALSGLVEMVFSTLMAPVVALRVTIFMAGLLFGRTVGWSGQSRDAYALSWAEAARGLWPQTLFGLGLAGAIIVLVGPATLVWAGPMVLGMGLAIPFAVVTASPAFGRWTERVGLCAVPDDIAPSPILRTLARVQSQAEPPRMLPQQRWDAA